MFLLSCLFLLFTCDALAAAKDDWEQVDGKAPWHARVDKASKNASGQIVMSGVVFNADDEKEIYGKFTAVAKSYVRDGKNAWAVVSLKTEPR